MSRFPLDDEGVWCQVLARPVRRRGDETPALFLDRDGVVVAEVDYLRRVEDVALIAGAADAIATANRCGVPVVMVTNQAGIARGYFGWAEFLAVQETILASLAAAGAAVDAVYACPHHPSGNGALGHPDHPARKPNPGMLLRAGRQLGIDLRQSWLIGDKASDVAAAKHAGLAGAMHVMTGYGEAERADAIALLSPGFEVRLAASIADAVALPLLRD